MAAVCLCCDNLFSPFLMLSACLDSGSVYLFFLTDVKIIHENQHKNVYCISFVFDAFRHMNPYSHTNVSCHKCSRFTLVGIVSETLVFKMNPLTNWTKDWLLERKGSNNVEEKQFPKGLFVFFIFWFIRNHFRIVSECIDCLYILFYFYSTVVS